jgi:excisionase family DNA binding protein
MTRPYTVPELPEPLQVPIKEAARLLGVCRETLYRMRKDQEIRFGRLRGRTLVPMAEIKRVHAQLYPHADTITQQPVEEPKKCRPKKMKLYPHVAQI